MINTEELLQVDALTHEGAGVASRSDGKKVFILGALPEEIMTVKVLKRHRRYEEATVLELKKASPERIEPPCAHFGLCGGCQLQHISYDSQLFFKQSTLKNILRQIGNLEFVDTLWTPPLSTESLGAEQPQGMGYRRKARIGVKWDAKKSSLYVGFRERASNKLAKLDSCLVLHPAVGLRFEAIKSLIVNLSIKDAIPQIEIAVGEEAVALVFRHLKPFTTEDLDLLKSFGKENQLSIYLQPGKNDSVHQLYPVLTEPNDLKNLLTYSIKIEDRVLNFQFHPLDFIQVNAQINNKMILQAIKWLALSETDTVADLFCGLGNFSLALALKAQKVIGVEAEVKAIERAKHNAIQNQLTDKTQFYAANLFDTETLASDQPWVRPVDAVVIDPPRSGAKEVCDSIERWSPKKILYVSCSPASFARDTAILLNEKNYELTHIGIMDMFPHTHHIETMALFTLKSERKNQRGQNGQSEGRLT